MKQKLLTAIALMLALAANTSAQTPVAHFDMSLNANGTVTESASQQSYNVVSQLPACTATGLDGDALRFDGYSNYVVASLPVSTFSTTALTMSVTLAAETYPMMRVEDAEPTPTYTAICSNLDESAKKGLALELSSQGDVRLRFGSATGFLMTVAGDKKLPLGQWAVLTAVLDKAKNAATLYLNGEQIGTGRMSRADIAHSTTSFFIGKDAAELKSGPFLINTFCGLIDDIAVYNEVTTPAAPEVAAGQRPDFNYPLSRYGIGENTQLSLWRPLFHAMPSGSWTNETHGMTYSDGRYHVFFQKNANGPYMAHLHWGHISSENLYDWREEPIAIAPGEAYDIKGCWSGCVYEGTDGTPNILYTAVDNARAVIAHATPTDASLLDWQKQGVIINGRPSGLSDDFRDPYYFTANGEQYVIVGTSKNGVGACTLHKLQNGQWTNNGKIFFQGGNRNQHGTFWEMPNVTPLSDGRYLFTCTPLNTGAGVRTLCWIGTIGSDGTFTPDATGVQYLELGGISRDGYGLLSPTIYQKDGKTLLLGIVPDKLPTQTNYEMGWAHNYSLPRELSVDANGQLVQKPYSGLAAMRTETAFSQTLSLQGTQSLAPVSGRQLEIRGEFTVATGEFGFHFLKSGSQQATLSYDADRGTITLDLTALQRQSNDGGSYNGIYTATLPEKPKAGEKLTLHLFLDGSIADIFVSDRWAFSVRLFPTDATATEAEAFATAQTEATLSAWTLDAKKESTGIEAYSQPLPEGKGAHAAVYDLCGRKIVNCKSVNRQLPKGVYIQNGKKIVNP